MRIDYPELITQLISLNEAARHQSRQWETIIGEVRTCSQCDWKSLQGLSELPQQIRTTFDQIQTRQERSYARWNHDISKRLQEHLQVQTRAQPSSKEMEEEQATIYLEPFEKPLQSKVSSDRQPGVGLRAGRSEHVRDHPIWSSGHRRS